MTKGQMAAIEHGRLLHKDTVALVPEDSVDEASAEALTQEYGPPRTIDRGELAYWDLSHDREVMDALRAASAVDDTDDDE